MAQLLEPRQNKREDARIKWMEQLSARQNKRGHPRIKTKLLGRYMLADRREFRCTIVDVALGGIALTGPEKGAIGETVVVYIDQLGRVEGDIVRLLEGGFAVKLTVTTRATEKLSRRLNSVAFRSGGTPRD